MVDATTLHDPGLLRRSVKIERYAEVLAHIVFFGTERTSEVVARFGFSIAAWRAVDAAWTDDLAEAIRRNQQDLALRFSAAFAKRRRRLVVEQPALSSVGDETPQLGAKGAASDSGTPGVALPSFMVAPKSEPEIRGHRVDVPRRRAPGRSETPTTQAMPAVSGTSEPLPFGGERPPEVALRAAIEHADAVQGPKPWSASSLGVTAPTEADRIAEIARRIMPFQKGDSAEDVASRAPPRSVEPKAADGPNERSDVAKTADADTPAFAPESSAEPISLTLEQHAALVVELSLFPEQSAATMRRYGLSSAQHARADAAWQAKISQDAAARATWDAAVAHYRAWFLRKKASS